MAELNTQKGKENLENAKETVEEFKRKYQQDIEDIRRQERKKETFNRGDLLGRFTVRKLFRQSDKWYNEEY